MVGYILRATKKGQLMTKINDSGYIFCDICENATPSVEVYHMDIATDQSWSETHCKYCFDDSLDWEEKYG